MFATDPLSLVFLICVVFSGVFLVLSSVLGVGHGHVFHLGAHTGAGAHTGGHVGHLGAHTGGHAAHAPGHNASASHSQAPHGAANAASAPAPASPPLWQTAADALLGALSLYGLLMFLLVFGLFGYLLHNATHLGAVVAILVPIFLGGLCAVATTAFLGRLFTTSPESELTAENSRLEGTLGAVSMTIRPGGVGEVVFTRPGMGRQSVSARSADGQAIAAGAEIVILGYADGIASVQPWDRFLTNARAGRKAPELDAPQEIHPQEIHPQEIQPPDPRQ